MKFVNSFLTLFATLLLGCTHDEYVVEAHYYLAESNRPNSYEIVKTTSERYAHVKYAETCKSYAEEFALAVKDTTTQSVLRGDSVVIYLLKISSDIDTLKVQPLVLK